MYIYYDKNGFLKEIVNDSLTNQYSPMKVYMYFEGANVDYVVQNIEVAVKVNDTNNSVSSFPLAYETTSAMVEPFDSKRQLKYFKNGKTYPFVVFDLTSDMLAYSGLLTITPTLYFLESSLVCGAICLVVQESAIVPTEMITQGEYLDLLTRFSAKANVSEFGLVEIDNTTSRAIILSDSQMLEIAKPYCIIIEKYIVYSNVSGYRTYLKGLEVPTHYMFAQANDTYMLIGNADEGRIDERYIEIDKTTKVVSVSDKSIQVYSKAKVDSLLAEKVLYRHQVEYYTAYTGQGLNTSSTSFTLVFFSQSSEQLPILTSRELNTYLSENYPNGYSVENGEIYYNGKFHELLKVYAGSTNVNAYFVAENDNTMQGTFLNPFGVRNYDIQKIL